MLLDKGYGQSAITIWLGEFGQVGGGRLDMTILANCLGQVKYQAGCANPSPVNSKGKAGPVYIVKGKSATERRINEKKEIEMAINIEWAIPSEAEKAILAGAVLATFGFGLCYGPGFGLGVGGVLIALCTAIRQCGKG